MVIDAASKVLPGWVSVRFSKIWGFIFNCPMDTRLLSGSRMANREKDCSKKDCHKTLTVVLLESGCKTRKADRKLKSCQNRDSICSCCSTKSHYSLWRKRVGDSFELCRTFRTRCCVKRLAICARPVLVLCSSDVCWLAHGWPNSPIETRWSWWRTLLEAAFLCKKRPFNTKQLLTNGHT